VGKYFSLCLMRYRAQVIMVLYLIRTEHHLCPGMRSFLKEIES
jgi:hypothetical protein